MPSFICNRVSKLAVISGKYRFFLGFFTMTFVSLCLTVCAGKVGKYMEAYKRIIE